MDTALLVVIGLVALFGVGALWAVRLAVKSRARPTGFVEEMVRLTEILKRGQSDLDGRLKQMTENQAATQAGLTDRLHAQERILSKALEERLSEISKRVHDGLEKSSNQTSETMGKLEARLAVIDEAQKNIQALGSQIVGLQDILANKQARGAFGEVQLEDLVRDALPPSAYVFQATLKSGRRVDCLLRLPNPPGAIAVDAKFPLESYRELREAADDAARKHAARGFRAAFTQHIRDIESKYIVPGETAESALMFLPSEAVYAELYANFPDVVETSHKAKVWIVSPTTLMATLLTVRAILKDVRMHEQTALIQREVGAMLKDVARLAERVRNLGRHFRQASEDVDQIQISTEKVTHRGEKIESLELEEAETKAPVRLVSGGDVSKS
ncbi:MAG: DNA recombination protein RmuC [Alphaproteobacteria bacterium]